MTTKTFEDVGIMSIGEMGLGIAQVLMAHGYRTYTYAVDRSQNTQSRARAAGVQLTQSLEHLVSSCSCILSIVPPRDAKRTAQRILSAMPTAPESRKYPLYYLDLNAISPHTATEINDLLSPNPNIILVDGGIIGGVPYLKKSGTAVEEKPVWHCPSLIVSGPNKLPDTKLSQILNIDHLDKPIGVATGLKMCFAVTTKGFVSMAIQSFTTAHTLGVMTELQTYLEKYNPATLKLAEKGLITMPPKAYRWVHEMMEISETMAGAGGFDAKLFQAVAEVYRIVAEDSELGKEQPGQRVRGKTVEDVIELLSEGMKVRDQRSNQ